MALANEALVKKRRRRGEFLRAGRRGPTAPFPAEFSARKEMKGTRTRRHWWYHFGTGGRNLKHPRFWFSIPDWTGRWHDLHRAGDNPNAVQKIDEAPRFH